MKLPQLPVKHTVEIKEEDKEYIDKKLGDLKQLVKTAGLTLAIGIPAVIIFGVAANFASEVAINRLTTH